MSSPNPIDSDRALIRKLVESVCRHPDNIELDQKEFTGRVDWRVRVHADDHSKMVGKKGTHVKAFEQIVKAIGKTSGLIYTWELREPVHGSRTDVHAPKLAKDYEPAPAHDLLVELVDGLGVTEYASEVVLVPERDEEEPDKLAYQLTIEVRTADDHRIMTTAIGALGTLFRARAARDGVKLLIAVDMAGSRSSP